MTYEYRLVDTHAIGPEEILRQFNELGQQGFAFVRYLSRWTNHALFERVVSPPYPRNWPG